MDLAIELLPKIIPFVAFIMAINILFGSYRNLTRKFSIAWWAAIHLPIPLIFVLRTQVFHLPLWIIPISFVSAIYGQILGSKWAFFGYRKEIAPEAGPESALVPVEVGAEVER